jgi:hypothetical protein
LQLNFAVGALQEKITVVARGTTAYSKGENYADKFNSALGCDDFGGFRKFDAGICGNQSIANPNVTADA